jgi:copper resistance protein C
MISSFRKAAALSLLSGLAATAAAAHAQLQQAAPPVGGTVNAAPSEISLSFSEAVEPRFSTVTLATEDGAAIALGRASADPSNAAALTVKIGQGLKPGVYVVTWHVVSGDTHKTQGSFRFTVSP